MSQAHPLWVAGREPGRQVVALGVAAALSAVALDLLLSGRVSFFFDLAFVALCVGLALRVRPRDFFMVGVLPPLLLLAMVLLLAAVVPEAIAAPGDSYVQAVVTGVAHRAASLFVGYALCLAVLAMRTRVLQRATTR